jgi:hypothetical protein
MIRENADGRPAGFQDENGGNRKLCSRQAKHAKKRVLKAERPIPDLDIFEKKQKNPFSPRPYIAVLFLVMLLNMV